MPRGFTTQERDRISRAGDTGTYRKTLDLLVDIVATGLTTREGDLT